MYDEKKNIYLPDVSTIWSNLKQLFNDLTGRWFIGGIVIIALLTLLFK